MFYVTQNNNAGLYNQTKMGRWDHVMVSYHDIGLTRLREYYNISPGHIE